MNILIDAVSWIALVTGGLLMVTSALGMVRLPNLFTRLHAGSLADTGGVGLILLGLILQTEPGLNTLKLLLIGFVLFLTTPAASHAVGHAALLGGLSPDSGDADDSQSTNS
ncbi:MAG: monovalent cation/H(+) antiporter subunit G [bacterium]|nr:monovalent cation/H(+) antiporter subunit G [bacterium]MDE0239012.1 monovalent cation/H(+) antiporter subunit G [bacterium]MDE0416383.1 monovalent cation/H(+) antiporter subunit G [bacterium]